jgi:hypothetical protein
MLPPPAAARIACLIADQGDRHGRPRALPATFLLAILAAFLAIAFHAAPPAGSLATPAVGASGSGEVRTEDPRMRFHSRFVAMAGAVALSVGGQAVAQDAVQWRVKDGGNGHWYARSTSTATWPDARALAESLGGHLATLTAPAEQNFLVLRGAQPGDWLGGYAPAGQGCSVHAWHWVTAESWSYAPWAPPEPNYCDEIALTFASNGFPNWNNYYPGAPSNYWIEFEADCNDDGLVDYGQIRTGDLPDANNNNIPDCCEQGVSCSPCAADIVRDGVVNGIDLAAVLTNWGTAGGSLNADVNQDGVVNGSDLAVVLAGWGPCP